MARSEASTSPLVSFKGLNQFAFRLIPTLPGMDEIKLSVTKKQPASNLQM
jgi:hypothetical protein